MKPLSLSAFVISVTALVKAAGQGNPWAGATTFLIPQFVDEVNTAIAK